MGYFNIFYKLTRIIDFLTRKRNRKFILALFLIGGIVFFSPNVANAQWSGLDSTNLSSCRTYLSNIDIYTHGVYTYIDDIYSQQLTANTNLTNIKSTLLDNQTYLIYQWQQLTNIHNDLLTAQDSLDHIDSDIHDLLSKTDDLLDKIDTLNTTITNILSVLENIDNNVEYYGELNHADLEDLKQIIKEYLYGDEEWFQVTFSSINGLGPVSQNGQIVFGANNGYTTYYFKVHSGSHYAFDWINTGTFANWKVRHGYCDAIPSSGVPTTTFATITSDSQITFVGDDTAQYYYITIYNQDIKQLKILSDYNYGQELGIYGGLTNIDVQVQEQGHETRATITEQSELTRNTITDTTYNQSDVNVNTSAIDNVSSTEIQGLFTTIFNNFNSAITGGTDSIVVPLPHGGQLVLYSNVVSSHLGNLTALVQAFWYFVFGLYAFKFVNNIIRSIKSGNILNGFSNNNEVITSSML